MLHVLKNAIARLHALLLMLSKMTATPMQKLASSLKPAPPWVLLSGNAQARLR
jgi:hypothetical protein